MKIKALTGIETSRHTIEEDEDGHTTLARHPISLNEGEVADVDDKVAQRLIKYGHASEDLSAETNLDRVRREAAAQDGR